LNKIPERARQAQIRAAQPISSRFPATSSSVGRQVVVARDGFEALKTFCRRR
jgi:hypothetical protein